MHDETGSGQEEPLGTENDLRSANADATRKVTGENRELTDISNNYRTQEDDKNEPPHSSKNTLVDLESKFTARNKRTNRGIPHDAASKRK